MEDEFLFHVEMETAKNIRSGMSSKQARRRALIAFGSMPGHEEAMRDGRGLRWLIDAATDMRYAVRMLARSRGFTIAALLTLGLGIGASTAIFSIVDAVLWRPLPFHEPERLMMVTSSNAAKGIVSAELTAADLTDFRARQDLFEGIAAIRYTAFTVTGGGEPERIEAARVSGDFFTTLGVSRAQVGRTLQASDDDIASSATVVLSHGYWRRRFGADPGAIGGTLNLDGTPHQIVGVLPEGFPFSRANALSDTPELWVPLALDAAAAVDRANHVYLGIARARRGISSTRAGAELASVAHRLEAEYPESNAGWSAQATPLTAVFASGAARPILVLFAGVLLLLLIAVANLANLSLARLLARRGEIAMRSALGASRGRLVRQMIAEGLLLAGAGGLAGVAVARTGIALLGRTDAIRLTAPGEIPMDARVLGFTLAVTLTAALVFVLTGVTRVFSADTARTVREHSRGPSVRGLRFRSALVVTEVALAVMLLAAAGLIGRSFITLSRVDPGFDADGAVALELPLARTQYQEPEQRRETFSRSLDALRALPNVTAVGAINQPPLGGSNSSASFTIQGAPAPADGVPPSASWRAVSAGYFRAMRIPIRSGRGFTERDGPRSPGVAVVSRAAAERFWPGEDPVGQRIVFVGDTAAHEIIGVVGDVKDFGLGDDFRPVIYLTYLQADVSRMTMVVRATGALGGLVPGLRRAIRRLDPDQPITDVAPLEEIVGRSLGTSRLRATLLASFAGAALLLASVGLYGVIAMGVQQRRQEIAMRIALGASPRAVVHVIIRQAIRLVLIGTGIGGAVALLGSEALEPLLFEVAPRDAGVFSGIVVTLFAIALLASWLPARRAARVDPAFVLRQE